MSGSQDDLTRRNADFQWAQRGLSRPPEDRTVRDAAKRDGIRRPTRERYDKDQAEYAKKYATEKEAAKPAALRTNDGAVDRESEKQGYRLIDDPAKKELDSPEQMREQAGLDGPSGQERTARGERKLERSPVMRPSTERRPHFRGHDQGDQGRGR